jgi:hypothetical protein
MIPSNGAAHVRLQTALIIRNKLRCSPPVPLNVTVGATHPPPSIVVSIMYERGACTTVCECGGRDELSE